MINVDVALKSILKDIKTLEAERIKLTDSLERVLAEDIYADADIPGFDNSAMDGFALKAADIRGASVNNPVFIEFPRLYRRGNSIIGLTQVALVVDNL